MNSAETCENPAGPALDLAYLLDYVMEEVKPLQWQAVVDSAVPLKVSAPEICKPAISPSLVCAYS